MTWVDLTALKQQEIVSKQRICRSYYYKKTPLSERDHSRLEAMMMAAGPIWFLGLS
jgi:hypothetical protein